MPTLIILCGEVYSGKAHRHLQQYAATHSYVTANPAAGLVGHGSKALSLHAANKQVIQVLKEGTNVVFVGENGSAHARMALISRARSAVTSLRVVGELLEPLWGPEQASWQQAWAFAEGLVHDISVSQEPIVAPSIVEDFDSLFLRRLPLFANNSPHQYSGAALFCELPALLEPGMTGLGPPDEPLVLRLGIADLFHSWIQWHPSGVIVVLLGDVKTAQAAAVALADPSISISLPTPPELSNAQLLIKVGLAIQQLQVPFPVFFHMGWALGLRHTVATLQYRHRLALPNCLLVTATAVSARGSKLAASLGLPCIDSDVLLTQLNHSEGIPRSSRLHNIIESSAEKNTECTPKFLQDVEYAWIPNPTLLPQPYPIGASSSSGIASSTVWHPILKPTMYMSVAPLSDYTLMVQGAGIPQGQTEQLFNVIFLHGAMVPSNRVDAFLTSADIEIPMTSLVHPTIPADFEKSIQDHIDGPPATHIRDEATSSSHLVKDADGVIADSAMAPFIAKDEAAAQALFGPELWGRGRKYFKHGMVLAHTFQWHVTSASSADLLGNDEEPPWVLAAQVRATNQVHTYTVHLAVHLNGVVMDISCSCLGKAVEEGKRCRHAAAVIWQYWALLDGTGVGAEGTAGLSTMYSESNPLGDPLHDQAPVITDEPVMTAQLCAAQDQINQPHETGHIATSKPTAMPMTSVAAAVGSPRLRSLPEWKKPKPKKGPVPKPISHQPKRPRTAYQRFAAECRLPAMEGGIGARARAIAEQWKVLPEDKKVIYERQYATEKEEYERQMRVYRERYPEEVAAHAAKRQATRITGQAKVPNRAITEAVPEDQEEVERQSSWQWNEEVGGYEHLSSDEEEEKQEQNLVRVEVRPPPARNPLDSPSATFNSLNEAWPAEEVIDDALEEPIGQGLPAPQLLRIKTAAKRQPPIQKRVQFNSREQVLATPFAIREDQPTVEVLSDEGTPLTETTVTTHRHARPPSQDNSQDFPDVNELFFGPPVKKARGQ